MAAISSEKPAPAGGSAAAAAVVLAAALLEKAARLSMRHWGGAASVRERAHTLRLLSEELIDADIHAYLAFVDAFRSARGMSAPDRERVLGPARAQAVDVPLAIVRAAAEVATLAALAVEHGNPNLRSDASVSCVLAAAGARAATITMATNLVDAPKDRRLLEARRLVRAAEGAARPGS